MLRSVPRLAVSKRAVAIKMSEGSSGPSVPVPSFVFHVLQKNPSIRELRLDERMELLMKEWNKLSSAESKKFLEQPLKGLV